ncbi:dopamine D2-like receptor [Arctopsyche grandis]|uniref:dopamine D2-like receptor n=1 Tax=Arctopsyche grandis TaxID=121162 RepID=UPI00406D6958
MLSYNNTSSTTMLPQETNPVTHSAHRHKPDMVDYPRGTRVTTRPEVVHRPSANYHVSNSTWHAAVDTTTKSTTPTVDTSVVDNRYFQYTNSYDNGSFFAASNSTSSSSSVNESKNGFLMLVEDFSDYFYNNFNTNLTFGENSTLSVRSDIFEFANCSLNGSLVNGSNCDGLGGAKTAVEYNYWALILVLFPFLTLFGNVLVILSVYRERTLQTVTNYFIVSLALADLLVAVVVMPFAVYVLFNGTWGLPPFVCDFYIAMDVICSTSSIFNLVAISIDRYIAVTQPIKYAKHKNNRRVWLTIVLVWVISAAIGSPIVLGLNNTPDRLPDLCLFYNSDFIIYSSLSSFYIPCIMMVFLYYNIFKALRNRARKQRAARSKPLPGDVGAGSVIENVAQTRRLAETALGPTKKPEEEKPTNTASGSNEEDDDGGERSPDVDADECHVISNDKSTEFILATVVEEAGNVMASLASPAPHNDANGNNDSGYAPSNLEEPIKEQASSGPNSPRVAVNKQQNQQQSQQQQSPQVAVVAQHKDGSVSFSKSAIKTFTNKNGATSSPRVEKLPMK